MREKTIFFGSGKYVLPVIEILNKGYDLELVVTTEKNPTDPVVSYCNKNNIKFLSVSTLKDFQNQIPHDTYKFAVLASFGLIVPNSVINMFPLGIINIHPSLLPKFRGPTPVQTAILSRAKTTGVTIMKLDAEVDHGPIIAMADYPTSESDTAESLYITLFKLGSDLLADALPKYVSGEIAPAEQNHSLATFTDHLTRESGFINIKDKQDGEKVKLMVRAYYPWPGVWFKANLNGKEKVIKLLPDNKIQVEGKNIMAIKDFANGYPEGREIISKLNLDERT